MNATIWTDRGDSAAREDLRAGTVTRAGEWGRNAVLAHLGLGDEGDTDAEAYGLAGEDLAEAQRAVLTGYARRIAEGL